MEDHWVVVKSLISVIPAPQDDLIAVTDAAKALRVSAWTVCKYVRDKQLSGYKLGGRVWIEKASLATLIASRRVGV